MNTLTFASDAPRAPGSEAANEAGIPRGVFLLEAALYDPEIHDLVGRDWYAGIVLVKIKQA